MEGHAATGYTYDRTIIQDNARAQLGDVHYHSAFNDHSCHTYIVCSASHYSSQRLRPYGPVSHETGESFSLKRKRCLDEKEQRPFKHNGESSLEKALRKLPKFSKRVKDQLKGPDAKKVVQQILAIIQAFQSNDLELHSNTSEDFENIDDCLRVARQVDINADFQRSGRSKLVRTTRRHNTATSGSWKIYLTATTVKSRDEDGSEVIKLLYSLCLEPQSPATGHPVQAYFGAIEHLGRTFLPPVVFAYRIIPNDSEVFEMIKQDNLQSLRELIENGTATTRDCDEENRSLLHVSLS